MVKFFKKFNIKIDIERWKYNPKYKVYVSTWGSVRDGKGKERKSQAKVDKRMWVRCNGDKVMVHRLVMETFKPCEGMENLTVDHLDMNTSNNHLSNLEWCTAKENIRRVDTSLHSELCKELYEEKRKATQMNNLPAPKPIPAPVVRVKRPYSVTINGNGPDEKHYAYDDMVKEKWKVHEGSLYVDGLKTDAMEFFDECYRQYKLDPKRINPRRVRKAINSAIASKAITYMPGHTLSPVATEDKASSPRNSILHPYDRVVVNGKIMITKEAVLYIYNNMKNKNNSLNDVVKYVNGISDSAIRYGTFDEFNIVFY